MQDLLTETEIRNLAKRLRITKFLLEGKTHEEIVQELHCSFATITKVGVWLANAGQGVTKIIKKLPKRSKTYRLKRTPGVGYGLPNILLHYASAYMTQKEKKRLEKFIESMRSKTATDQDFREELAAEFAQSRRKRAK